MMGTAVVGMSVQLFHNVYYKMANHTSLSALRSVYTMDLGDNEGNRP